MYGTVEILRGALRGLQRTRCESEPTGESAYAAFSSARELGGARYRKRLRCGLVGASSSARRAPFDSLPRNSERRSIVYVSRLSSLAPSCGASRFLGCESGSSAKESCRLTPLREGMKRSE